MAVVCVEVLIQWGNFKKEKLQRGPDWRLTPRTPALRSLLQKSYQVDDSPGYK